MRNHVREHGGCSIFINKLQVREQSLSRLLELEKQKSGQLSPLLLKTQTLDQQHKHHLGVS